LELEAAGAAERETAYFCKTEQARKPLETLSKTLGIEGPSACLSAALNHINADTHFPESPLSYSKLKALNRLHDPTREQPGGTDGPFWILGSFSLFAQTGKNLQLTNQYDCINCQLPSDFDSYQKLLVDHVNMTSRSIFGDCNLGDDISKFIQANRSSFKSYYDGYKKLAELTVEGEHLVQDIASKPEVQKLIPALKQELFPDSSTRDPNIDSKDVIRKVLQTFISAKFGYDDFYDNKKKGLLKLLSPNISEREADEWANRYQKLDNDRRDALNAQNDAELKIIPKERELYEWIKAPRPAGEGLSEYQKCLAMHPELQSAQKACEDFQI
jgi:hypothetical protein